ALTPSAAVPTIRDRENTHGYISPVGLTQSLPFQQSPQSSSNPDETPLLFEPRPMRRFRSMRISLTPNSSKNFRVASMDTVFWSISTKATLTSSPFPSAHLMLCTVFEKLPAPSVIES